MSRLKEGENPRSVNLNFIDLWVQVHDLKAGFMSEKILMGIGNYIGHYVASCPSNFVGVWREYMRVRVTLSLDKPLKRRMKIKMSGNEWFWVNFKYENVPNFCFICGIVGHSERFCSQLFEKSEEEIMKPYGSWMRAPLKRQVKPVGAKWLRNGEVGDSSETRFQDQYKRNEEDDECQDPKFAPGKTGTVIHGGSFAGNSVQNSKLGGNCGNNSIITNSPTISALTKESDIVVIESKKRRTNDGLDSSELGRTEDILMDSDDIQMSDRDNRNADNKLGSKNYYGAGTQVGTRQSS